MIKIAAAVRKGANAYLKQQYKVVAMFFVVIWAPHGLAWASAFRIRSCRGRSSPGFLLRSRRLGRNEDGDVGVFSYRRGRTKIS